MVSSALKDYGADCARRAREEDARYLRGVADSDEFSCGGWLMERAKEALRDAADVIEAVAAPKEQKT
jgi:hypothetical protein